MEHPYILFHEIADPACAAARRFVTEHVPEGVVRFRNVAYPEVHADYTSYGGSTVPALWDGTTLTSGSAPVMQLLMTLRATPQ